MQHGGMHFVRTCGKNWVQGTGLLLHSPSASRCPVNGDKTIDERIHPISLHQLPRTLGKSAREIHPKHPAGADSCSCCKIICNTRPNTHHKRPQALHYHLEWSAPSLLDYCMHHPACAGHAMLAFIACAPHSTAMLNNMPKCTIPNVQNSKERCCVPSAIATSSAD